MVGQIKLEKFAEVKLPQKAQSAWTGATSKLIGATLKPIVYLGSKLVNGTNYYFIAERSTLYKEQITRTVILLRIHELNGVCEMKELDRLAGQ